ncbi:MAG TPA: hypothetical protein ENK63_00680, partial [Rhodobacterales bacterium]|nr:hypothetical protein [Rhodobacterales bacterium]
MTRDQITLGLALSAILLASQARADEALACLERSTLVARLAEQYGERLQSVGLAGEDRLMELFASPETGSWTMLVTA